MKSIWPPDDVSVRLAELAENPTGEWTQSVRRHQAKDGTILIVEATSYPLLYEGREARVVIANDVTERNRAVEELERQRAFLRQVIDINPNFVFAKDRAGRFTLVNQAVASLYGTTVEDLLGKTDADFSPNPEDVVSFRRTDLEVMDSRREKVIPEERFTEPRGRIRWLEKVKRPIVGNDGVANQVLGVAIDITERRRAEAELKKSEERYRLLFESNPQPMWVFDEETFAFLAVNNAACVHYGYTREEFLGMTIRDIRPPEDGPALARQIASESSQYPQAGVRRHRRKDGSVIDVEITSHPLVFEGRSAQFIFALDVTQRRKLEAQVRQSQKMEAVGQLAGGVAHDFNNLLTAILGYAELLAPRLRADPSGLEEVAEITKAGERAASLTRQLLAFSRRQVLELKVLDLNTIVRSVEKMLRRLIGEDIDLVATLDSSLAPVRADAGQIEQVIVNLVVNARDAMPDGGKITIETANVEHDDAYARQHVTGQPGKYVMIAVTDTGIGMDAATQSRIFEPFFTTKAKDKGTGLGLSTVYGIVKQSGGYIWTYSEVRRGTTFKVYLPRVEGVAEAIESPMPKVPSARATETILLVEDDASLRKLALTILKGIGYTVLDAGTGADALEITRKHTGPIDLVLTDVVMPEMSGSALVSALRAARPGVPVLYMSGYTDDAIFRHNVLEPGVAFLQKPFTPASLTRKVREVLDARE
jgi:PAS domain S-box-containing protein